MGRSLGVVGTFEELEGSFYLLVEFTDMVWGLKLSDTQVFLFRWRLQDLLQNCIFYVRKKNRSPELEQNIEPCRVKDRGVL